MTSAPELDPVPPPALRLVPPDLPDTDLSTEELGSRIVGLAGRIAAATCRWLLLVAEFDRRDGCQKFGLTTTAAWLMHTCGLSRRTAFEHVRVARAMLVQPPLADRMETGRLSYSQVRAISRVVPDPDDRETAVDLSEAAQHCSVEQLETVVRGMRTVDQNEAGGPPEDDYVRTGWTNTGRWRMSARLAPEQGQLVTAAIAAIAKADGLTHAEALVRMAEVAIAAANDTKRPPRPLRGDERAAIVVHLNAADVPRRPSVPTEKECSVEHSTEPDRGVPAGRIADGPGLAWPVVEALLCQGRIRTEVLDGAGNIAHLGRSHRVVSWRQFRALLRRDRGECAFPGCSSHAGLQAHHVRHWIDGGRTDLENLVLLCHRHHLKHHEGEFDIVPQGRDRFRFVGADGIDLSAAPDVDALAQTADHVETVYAGTADDAATPRWDGTRIDRVYAVNCLSDSKARRRRRLRMQRNQDGAASAAPDAGVDQKAWRDVWDDPPPRRSDG